MEGGDSLDDAILLLRNVKSGDIKLEQLSLVQLTSCDSQTTKKRQPVGFTLLAAATHEGNAVMIKSIIASIKQRLGAVAAADAVGTIISHQKSEGEPSLMPTSFNPLDLVELRAGSEVHLDDQCTPLHIAVKRGHLDALRALLEYARTDTVNKKNGRGRTALFLAALLLQVDAVRDLLAAGAEAAAICDGDAHPYTAVAVAGWRTNLVGDELNARNDVFRALIAAGGARDGSEVKWLASRKRLGDGGPALAASLSKMVAEAVESSSGEINSVKDNGGLHALQQRLSDDCIIDAGHDAEVVNAAALAAAHVALGLSAPLSTDAVHRPRPPACPSPTPNLLVLSAEDCTLHEDGARDKSERVMAVLEALRRSADPDWGFLHVPPTSTPPASVAPAATAASPAGSAGSTIPAWGVPLATVHAPSFLEGLCRTLCSTTVVDGGKRVSMSPSASSVAPELSHSQKQAIGETLGGSGTLAAVAASLLAARVGVDTVCGGVTGRSSAPRAALVVVRPPSHHAGAGRRPRDGSSAGFCLSNTLLATALYATLRDAVLRSLAGLQAAPFRVAIVDIDAHNGNGTTEVLQSVAAAIGNMSEHVIASILPYFTLTKGAIRRNDMGEPVKRKLALRPWDIEVALSASYEEERVRSWSIASRPAALHYRGGPVMEPRRSDVYFPQNWALHRFPNREDTISRLAAAQRTRWVPFIAVPPFSKASKASEEVPLDASALRSSGPAIPARGTLASPDYVNSSAPSTEQLPPIQPAVRLSDVLPGVFPQVLVASVHQHSMKDYSFGYGGHTIHHDGIRAGDFQTRWYSREAPFNLEASAASLSRRLSGGSASGVGQSSGGPSFPQSTFVAPQQGPFLASLAVPIFVPTVEAPGTTVVERGSVAEWQDALTSHILPALKTFAPTLVIVAAGFDGAKDDCVGRLSLSPADYGAIPAQLSSACPGANFVAFLEGGYGADTDAADKYRGLEECTVAFARGLAGVCRQAQDKADAAKDGVAADDAAAHDAAADVRDAAIDKVLAQVESRVAAAVATAAVVAAAEKAKVHHPEALRNLQPTAGRKRGRATTGGGMHEGDDNAHRSAAGESDFEDATAEHIEKAVLADSGLASAKYASESISHRGSMAFGRGAPRGHDSGGDTDMSDIDITSTRQGVTTNDNDPESSVGKMQSALGLAQLAATCGDELRALNSESATQTLPTMAVSPGAVHTSISNALTAATTPSFALSAAALDAEEQAVLVSLWKSRLAQAQTTASNAVAAVDTTRVSLESQKKLLDSARQALSDAEKRVGEPHALAVELDSDERALIMRHRRSKVDVARTAASDAAASVDVLSRRLEQEKNELLQAQELLQRAERRMAQLAAVAQNKD